MKTYKISIIKQGTIITPIAPRITIRDGVKSVLNITGTYYNTNPNLDALCNASNNIVNLNEVWVAVGDYLRCASAQYANMNNINAKFSNTNFCLNKHIE